MTNTLLDVDESLIKRNLLLSEKKEEDEEFDRLLKSLDTKHIPSVIFRPLPGVCVKTKTDKGEKIFVNVCHTTEIPAPEDISDDRFHQILDEDPPSWCIPMSIGSERVESDKNGAECLTYDIAINREFFEKCQEKKPFFAFVVLTMLSAIGEKYDKIVDTGNYVVLKNKKVMGKLQDHRVQKREVKQPVPPTPLIQEISAKEASKVKAKRLDQIDSSQYVILRKPAEGQVERLIGYFKLPYQCSKRDVKVDVGLDRILIEATNCNYLVDTFVSYSIVQNSVTASMDPNLNILRLDMPVTSA